MAGWQPIETAPKDGTKILGCDSNGELAVVHWDQNLVRGLKGFQIGIGGVNWNWLQHYFIPVMWQPLPNSPDG